MADAEEYVNKLIKDNSIVIFSKSYCPFCRMAKEAFEKIDVKFHAVELDEHDNCDNIQDVLHRITGARSVPRVFVKGQFIGGGTDVKKMQEKGELAKLVK